MISQLYLKYDLLNFFFANSFCCVLARRLAPIVKSNACMALCFIFFVLKDNHDFIHHHVFFRFRWSFLLRKECPYSKFFWSVFSCILTEYSASLCIQSKCGKIRIRITPNKNNFHTVFLFLCNKPPKKIEYFQIDRLVDRLVDQLFPRLHSSSTEEFSILFHCSLSSLRWSIS